MKKAKSFLIAIVLVAISGSLFAQTLDEIVETHVKAIGGKVSWATLKTLKIEGSMKMQGTEIKTITYQVDKKAMRQEITVGGMTGFTLVTNTEGYSFMPFAGQTKPEPMTADDLKNTQDQLYLQEDFITYSELGKKIEFLGKEDVDGTECFKIKMTNKNNQETTYFIDAESYLIIKQTAKIKSNGREFDNTTIFGNYKTLENGIIYPTSITSGFGQAEITKIEINPAIDESVFKVSK